MNIGRIWNRATAWPHDVVAAFAPVSDYNSVKHNSALVTDFQLSVRHWAAQLLMELDELGQGSSRVETRNCNRDLRSLWSR